MAKKKKFDPEGSGYDYEEAIKGGEKPKKKGEHWSSRNPKTGQILKGKKHKTFHLAEKGEKEAGNEIYKKGKKYYSHKPGEVRGKKVQSRVSPKKETQIKRRK